MKNVVKCYKDFFGYFNALKTHSETAQTDNNVFQNMANRPTVYKIGTPAIQIVAINAKKHDKNRWLRAM